MPLAKSAPQPPEQTIAPSIPEPVSLMPQIENVPLEVYRFFSIDPFQNKDSYVTKQIKEIYNWANEEDKGLGDAIWRMRQVEMKLGAPAIGETRYTKLYNYIKISRITESLERERNMQLEKTKRMRQAKVQQIEEEKRKELAQIEKTNKLEETQIKKQHEKVISQMKKIRSAFEKGV